MTATVPRDFSMAWGDLGLIQGITCTLSGGAGLGGLGLWRALRNGFGGPLGGTGGGIRRRVAPRVAL